MAVHHERATSARWSRWAGALASVSIALTVASCGGTDLAGVGSGGTGISVASVSYGSISGFGSVIVNGVHFDERAAAVSNDDGTPPAPLGLGMVIEVRGDIDSTGLAGTADTIKVFSEARGTVAGLSTSGFTLLGLPVRTTVNTVYEEAAAVADGDYVEVYGLYDRSTGTLTATRIERKAPGADYKVRGTIAALDAAAKRFQLGTLTVDYSAASPAPTGLANGVQVRVRASSEPVSGVLAATRVDVVATPDLGDVSKVEIEGVVDRFASLADFSVDGVRVDASKATLEGGTLADLTVGRRVEVEGPVQAGVVAASKVEFEDDDATSEFELKGLISGFVDVGHFIVRATPVDASGSVTYEGGSALNLRDGACVEVKGTLQSTPTGSKVLASKIQFESSCN